MFYGRPLSPRSWRARLRNDPMPIPKDILACDKSQAAGDKRICDALAKALDQHLPGTECKIWHAHPVWFLEGNPIVGYHKLKDCVRLMFWSGRSFEEPGLKPVGGFKTDAARYTSDDQIAAKELKRSLKKSIEIQWDYKNIVKRKGKLERVKTAEAITLKTKTPSKAATVSGAGLQSSHSQKTEERNDWRVVTLAGVRRLIQQADPDVVEEVKWRKPSNPAGVPVWSHDGILCTGETYKSVVKLTFAKGASLPDSAGLFNSSLEVNTRRAIDLHERDKINVKAFKSLIRAAVALNTSAAEPTGR